MLESSLEEMGKEVRRLQQELSHERQSRHTDSSLASKARPVAFCVVKN